MSKNAVMVTDVLFPTANVVTVKLADVWPPGTLTMPGTWATDELLVASVTKMPRAGAGELKNTGPVEAIDPARPCRFYNTAATGSSPRTRGDSGCLGKQVGLGKR